MGQINALCKCFVLYISSAFLLVYHNEFYMYFFYLLMIFMQFSITADPKMINLDNFMWHKRRLKG